MATAERTIATKEDLGPTVQQLTEQMGEAALDGRAAEVERLEQQIAAIEQRTRLEVAKAGAQLKRQAAKVRADRLAFRRKAHAALVSVEGKRREQFTAFTAALGNIEALIATFSKLSRTAAQHATDVGISAHPWREPHALVFTLMHRLTKAGVDLSNATRFYAGTKHTLGSKDPMDLLPTIPEFSEEDK